MVDLYNILNVEPSADEQQIKVAFRRLAKKYHPDVSNEPNANAKFKDIYTAYEVLSDPNRKLLYDGMRQESSNYGQAYPSDYAESTSQANMDDWQSRAGSRAEKYANMPWGEFKKKELKGMDFIQHQFALFIAMSFFFLMSGGMLYFAQTIVVAFFANKAHWSSLIGAAVLSAIAILILTQVFSMGRAFGAGYLKKQK